jgi:RNA polymerase sigma-70 factor (ECF subfamily)
MTTEQQNDLPGLLDRALEGDADAVCALFSGQRERLKRLVRLRLSRDLAGQVDEAKVVDEILTQAKERLAAYAAERARPLSLWVRDLGCRKLAELHGRYQNGARRDRGGTAAGELTLHAGGLPIANAEWLAAQIRGKTVDGRAHDRAERRVYLQETLNTLEVIDREVIALKHFERLGFREIAQVLGLTEAEAGRRYLDAIRRLREMLPWDGDSRHS